jgi:hypothetical protein
MLLQANARANAGKAAADNQHVKVIDRHVGSPVLESRRVTGAPVDPISVPDCTQAESRLDP